MAGGSAAASTTLGAVADGMKTVGENLANVKTSG
ncbi:MAG: hypothetical protein ACPGXY_01935, partial [Alphaproteobacteria bacterium]